MEHWNTAGTPTLSARQVDVESHIDFAGNRDAECGLDCGTLGTCAGHGAELLARAARVRGESTIRRRANFEVGGDATTDICPEDLLCIGGLCQSEPAEQQCGDGIRSGTEICDDGNVASGDGCTADCTSATCLVPVTHDSVTELVADAGCGSGYIYSGRYAEVLTIKRDLGLEGVGAARVILDGFGNGRVVTVEAGATVTLRNFTVTNGLDQRGGGVRNEGSLTLESMRIVDNMASGIPAHGGGVYHTGNTLTVIGTEISGNTATSTGGDAAARGAGLFIEGPTTFTGDCAIEDNTSTATGENAKALGAGIYATGNDLSVISASLANNEATVTGPDATAAGGAVYFQDGNLQVINVAATDNRATANDTPDLNRAVIVTGSGGALFLVSSTVTLDNFVATANTAAGETARGGAINLKGPQI